MKPYDTSGVVAARPWSSFLWSGGPEGGEAEPPPTAGPGLVYPAYVPAVSRGKGVQVVPGEVGIEIFGGGALVRLLESPRPGKPPVNVQRGKVRGMSKDSRLRQLKFVNAIDRSKIKGILFLTLTRRGGQSSSVVESWEQIEAARRKWFKRLERYLAGRRWFAMWRKEPHKSGHAHLHVLLFFLEDPPHLVREFRPWNDLAWAASVGDLSIAKTACSSELLRSWNGVASYLCKYLGKEQDLAGCDTGKVWDVVHRQQVPINLTCRAVKTAVANKYRRVCRKWQQRKAETWQACIDGEWRTIRPWRSGARVLSVADQVQRLKAGGVRVRRRRPRLCCTRGVRVWAETVESSAGGVRRGLEYLGDELHTFFAGSYFLPADLAARLVEWAGDEYLRVQLLAADLPF